MRLFREIFFVLFVGGIAAQWHMNPLMRVWYTLLPNSSSESPLNKEDDCTGCAQNKVNVIVPDPLLTELRVEYVKQQILKKLRLSKPPEILMPLSTLPQPVINGNVLLPDLERPAENFYGKTNQVVVFPSEGVADSTKYHHSSNHITGFNLAVCFTFYLPNEMLYVDVTSAELWFYKEQVENDDELKQTFVLSELDHWDQGGRFEKNTVMAIFETDIRGIIWIYRFNGCFFLASDAVNILHQRGICQQTNAPIELVASDILDHYRTYALLEKLLHTPTKLASEQLAFQIEPQTSQMLIEMYYEFDDVVIRELLGKKITSKSRKDMDEVAEKTGITLKSCRRQYDNVKRVFKIVEDLPGSLAVNIKQHFLLSEDLAKRYAAVVFIACLRFEMNKRKLQFLTFPDLYHCANSMMSSWTYRCVGSEYFDTDLDREFLQELSECRALLENDKHHKHLVCLKLKPMLLDRSYQELDINFRSYSRAILCIGCNLHRSRELRFFFLELVERCIEPWRQVNWTHSDLRNFLAIYTQCALDMDVLREGELRDAFERYMTVVTCCLLRMYHT
ncbi:Acidic fibroblast growth factor intracellular-binding protein [Cyphomyrmex costatus]|uniref:Acidic fibroblast growth factor intracellular-binding protein n=1 Tax=Cyphomyrmex costatus TaxID=456900 RepID=A0A151IGS7_9HYME|nr:Acidic fibroblast growth factor intracellular-binding protein [Cyphomyrmex costatus]